MELDKFYVKKSVFSEYNILLCNGDGISNDTVYELEITDKDKATEIFDVIINSLRDTHYGQNICKPVEVTFNGTAENGYAVEITPGVLRERYEFTVDATICISHNYGGGSEIPFNARVVGVRPGSSFNESISKMRRERWLGEE